MLVYLSHGQDDKTWLKNLFSKEVTEKNEKAASEEENVTNPSETPTEVKKAIETKQENGVAANQTGGSVSWVMPEKLSFLNDSLVKNPNPIKGYRVVLFSGPLDAAKKFRSDFVLKNPEVPCYLQHAVPNFEIRIGNCREKQHAYELMSQIKAIYPGAYVVKDDIEQPKLVAPE